MSELFTNSGARGHVESLTGVLSSVCRTPAAHGASLHERGTIADLECVMSPARPGAKKYVLFDVDGTLSDALDNQRRMWRVWAER